MLQIKHITKTYQTGDLIQHALQDFSVNFRENEFVSILGPSGSGKTTLLNIVGGLDRYTHGDLVINGISTKDYKDSDWDIYRNDSIGFVFQSYNLIPHQSVLSNVELALTLAGVSKSERRSRAIKVLKKVGLEAHLHKKPNQMSGGQMQRIAIARALVNNPDILLADEPTGALDSETSVQIMELLMEIAKDKLVIMVTHNPDLAEQYSTRIIRLLDGQMKSDTNPFQTVDAVLAKENSGKKKKVSLSFMTALSLSFNNLKTKKGRTILTSFAGSIGIIGIALILSLSSGMQGYIGKIEQDTLSTYPISIQSQTINIAEARRQRGPIGNIEDVVHDATLIYQGGYVADTLKRTSIQMQNNDLKAFKEYLQGEEGKALLEHTNAIQYGYEMDLQIYKSDITNGILQLNPSTSQQSEQPAALASITASMGVSSDVWTELVGNDELLASQYDVLAGAWPTAYNEVIVVVDENNEISDATLYALGLKSNQEYEEIAEKIKNGETVDNDSYATTSYSFAELLQMTFKLVMPTDYYTESNGIWLDQRSDEAYMKQLLDDSLTLQVVGIVRPAEDATAASISGTVAYQNELTNYVIDVVNQSEIVKQQIADADVDVFGGKPFSNGEDAINLTTAQLIAQMTNEQKAYVATLSEGERASFIEKYSPTSSATYEDNLEKLGVIDANKPSSIDLYLKNFDSRDMVVDLIADYNDAQLEAGNESYVIEYTDMVGMMMSSITSIIDMITYALIGFVSISLVVSSIMIGIITYISVLERTKEIGILRSIGASKKDISSVFNAETIIIGLVSGLLGIGITIVLNIPISAIIKQLSGVSGIASLPINGGIALVSISVILTVIAGLIPSRMAAKKDPVEALRSE